MSGPSFQLYKYVYDSRRGNESPLRLQSPTRHQRGTIGVVDNIPCRIMLVSFLSGGLMAFSKKNLSQQYWNLDVLKRQDQSK